MTTEKTYYPTAGTNVVIDASIAYIKPLMVSRSGMVHNLTTDSGLVNSDDNFYSYTSATGTLTFNVNYPFNTDESVNIIYETNP